MSVKIKYLHDNEIYHQLAGDFSVFYFSLENIFNVYLMTGNNTFSKNIVKKGSFDLNYPILI